jgi:prolyl 4-hydroxylase
MKTKIRGRSGNPLGYKLGLPQVLLCCAIFFFAGYYGSNTFFQEEEQAVVDPDTIEKVALDHGLTGDSSITDLSFQVLSWKPRALLYPNFASKKQCEAIIKLARTRLAPSGLALRKGETADTTKEIRTSSGAFLRADEDKSRSLWEVEEKMARATMIPRSNGEAFNVLRYNLGQKYDCHYDVFDPAEYGPQPSQRMASFLLYLSDVEEGGETMFPFENLQNMQSGYDYKECLGLKVKPRQGDALLFYSMHPNGTFDKTALHGSCPVIKGEKWVATKWIRNTDKF